MQILCSIVLLVNALFAIVVWPRFWTRIKADTRSWDEDGKPTKFLTVHRTLISTALVLAVISAVVGILGLIIR